MALVTKQNVCDIYRDNIRLVAVGTFTVDSITNPGAARIKIAELGDGIFPNPQTSDLPSSTITASEITTAFSNDARTITTIRTVRHGFIVDNFSPDTAETTTDDTTTTADLKSTYETALSSPPSGPGTGNLIDLSDLEAYADGLYTAADKRASATVDLRVCHGSCHSSCHSSRGRR